MTTPDAHCTRSCAATSRCDTGRRLAPATINQQAEHDRHEHPPQTVGGQHQRAVPSRGGHHDPAQQRVVRRHRAGDAQPAAEGGAKHERAARGRVLPRQRGAGDALERGSHVDQPEVAEGIDDRAGAQQRVSNGGEDLARMAVAEERPQAVPSHPEHSSRDR